MSNNGGVGRLVGLVERGILIACQTLLLLVVLVALFQLWYLFVVAIHERIGDLTTITRLTEAVQGAFSGILLIILGLELIETLRVYFEHHQIRLEVIFSVALIAVGRHIIQIDLVHVSGPTLAGVAALVVALTAGYVLLRSGGLPGMSGRSHRADNPEGD